MKLALMLVLAFAAAAPLPAQSSRAQQYATDFTKHKDVTRNKKGVALRKFRDVRALPWVPVRFEQYAGHYESDLMEIDVAIRANGDLVVTGRDEQPFRVEHAAIDEAVLKGTRVYRNGMSKAFEAAFLTRWDRLTPDAAPLELHGLGVYLDRPVPSTGLDRVFLLKR